MKYLLAALVLGGAGAWWYYASDAPEFVPEIRTVETTRGDIVESVSATGSLEAVTTVQIGSQVSGIIQELRADYNAIVREGDVIARLDPSLFETQIEQARANLLRAEADVERLRVAVDDAHAQHARSVELAAQELISQTELETSEVNVRSATAQLRSAEAQVIQARASLNQNEVNLEHTVIRAPIDGIVISRLVDVGQTVAASLQAPELFVIAADLTKMRVIANVDESDVGRIRPRQPVSFVVDAYPDETFGGVVSQIRLEPIVQQNVVTYATVIDAPNPDLKLKPGMTATATIEIARRDGVVRVPNAALRFRPAAETFMALNQPAPDLPPLTGSAPAAPPDPERLRRFRERVQQLSPEERERFRERRRDGRGRPAAGTRARPANAAAEAAVPAVARGATTIDALFGPLPQPRSTGRVWLLEQGRLLPVDVTLGLTDGTSTELVQGGAAVGDEDSGAALAAGTALVSFISTPEAGAATRGASTSPLIPSFGPPGRRR